MRLSFADIFGVGSSQTTQFLIIDKASIGVNTDSPEAILIALLNRCLVNGVIDGFTFNGEDKLEYSNALLYEVLNVIYARDELTNNQLKSVYRFKILLPGNQLDDGFSLEEI
jgi:hypothetical protein